VDLLGFVFFPPSPRHLSFARASELSSYLPDHIQRVGLFVDPDDRMLDEAMNAIHLDLFQLHGSESPERVEAIRLEYGMPVMKAVGIAGPEDFAAIAPYLDVADRLLLDAKAPKGSDRPGGHGLSFDWSLLQGRTWGDLPWMLAGGLGPDNIIEALRQSGARAIDVSSGVESAPGIKDPAKIEALMRAISEFENA